MKINLDRAFPPGLSPRRWQVEALTALASTDCPAPLVHAVMGSGKSIAIVALVRAALAGGARRIVVSAPTEALVGQLCDDLGQYVGRQYVGAYYGRSKCDAKPVVVTCFPSTRAMVEVHGAGCDLWVVDECHLEADRERDAFAALQPKWRVGFSATPFRSDEQGLTLWDSVVYSYGIGKALADSVLVPWEVVHPEEGNVDLDDACIAMLRATPPVGSGIIGARSIEDAETFCERLQSEGYAVAPIHSGLGQQAKDKALADLKACKLKALVHVDMLTTGVNIPWLSWLMLRRRYASRTSFLQFFGRGLRSSEGKSKVTIYDPWMQLDSFSIEYAAQLGGEAKTSKDQAPQPEDEIGFDLIDLPPFHEMPKIPHLTAKRAVSAWCRAVLHAAQAADVAPASPWDGDGSWRRKPASPKQVAALQKMSWGRRHLPDGAINEGVKALLETPEHLTAGAASDLQSVLSAGLDKGREARETRSSWRWTPPLVVPALPKRVKQAIKKV